ncbi:MAG: hypothetical protein V9E81_14910 [Marmoricola sp.]
MSEIAGARPVRAEDAFDVAAVVTWLNDHGVAIESAPEVRQFVGGASNLTFSLRTATRDLILAAHPRARRLLVRTTWAANTASSRRHERAIWVGADHACSVRGRVGDRGAVLCDGAHRRADPSR